MPSTKERPVFIKSYRTALLVLFTTLLVLTVVSIMTYSYWRTSQATLQLSRQVTTSIAEETIARMASVLRDAENHIRVNAEMIKNHPDLIAEQDKIFSVFWQQLNLTPQLITLFVADTQNNMLEIEREPRLLTRVLDYQKSSQERTVTYRDAHYQRLSQVPETVHYQPISTDWFKHWLNTNTTQSPPELYWSDIHIYDGTQGISVTYPVLNAERQLQAVVGAYITLESLSKHLSKQSFGKDDIALIIDDARQLVAYPSQRLKFLPEHRQQRATHVFKLEDIDEQQSWLKTAYQQLHPQAQQKAQNIDSQRLVITDLVFKEKRTRYIASLILAPEISGKRWSLMIAAPESDLLSEVDKMLRETLVISVIILIASIFAIYVLIQHIFSPIEALTENTSRIKALRFEEIEPVNSSFQEIQAMDEALLSMTRRLQAYSKYSPSEVVKLLLNSGDKEALEIGGRLQEVVGMALALDNFSDLCQCLDANELTKLLSRHINEFSRIIQQDEGMVDQFSSDTLLALWNMPLSIPNSPYQACNSALRCREVNQIVNHELHHHQQPPMRYMLALHGGKAVVGNIGTRNRLHYTAISESMEFLQRLRYLNRWYGTDILVTETLQNELEDVFVWRLVDKVKLFDGSRPLRIYHLLDKKHAALPSETLDLANDYAAAFEAYSQQQWQTALSKLAVLHKAYPDDKPTQVLYQRCQKYQANSATEHAPPKDWDGALVINSL